MALVQLCLSVILAVLAVVMVIGQWIMAGEFRWFIGVFMIIMGLTFILVRLAYKEWKETMR